MSADRIPGTNESQPAGNAAFSPRFAELVEALESLYIPANLSGRLHFREDWPLAAERVFGEELMQFDADGTKDKERRAELEEQAEQNRQALLAELEDIRENSLKNSMLELDYIKATMQKLGRGFSAYIFADNLIEKFMPEAPEAPQATPVADKPAGDVPPDPLDDVAPIDADAPGSPVAQQPAERPEAESSAQTPQSGTPDAPPAGAEPGPVKATPWKAPQDEQAQGSAARPPQEPAAPDAPQQQPPPDPQQQQQQQQTPGGPQSSSPLDLGKKRAVLQVDPTHSQPVSYDALVQKAGEEAPPEAAPQKAHPSKGKLAALFNGRAAGDSAAPSQAAPGQ